MTKVAVAGLALMWLVSLPFLSHERAETWTDEEALWASAQLWSPVKLRPTVEYARLLHLAGRLDEAERRYKHAIALWSIERPAHEVVGCEIAAYNLAILMQQRGRWQDADRWGGYRCVLPR